MVLFLIVRFCLNITLVYNPKSGSSFSRRHCAKSAMLPTSRSTNLLRSAMALNANCHPPSPQAHRSPSSVATARSAQLLDLSPTLKQRSSHYQIGTLNHFTKDLDIPQDVDEALARLRRLKPHTIDIASVNDMMFINNSSIGLYPASLRSRSMSQNSANGPQLSWRRGAHL